MRGDVYHNFVASLEPVAGGASSTSSPTSPSASTCSTARGPCSRASGSNNPRFNSWRRGFAVGFAGVIVVGNVSFPIAVLPGIDADDNLDCVAGDVIVDGEPGGAT